MAGVDKRVIVLGGGIGGPCAAISLRQIGVDVVVYEQAAVLNQVGAGLTIWANAIKALRKLGLADAVINAGSKIERGQICAARGRILSLSEPGRSNDCSANRQSRYTAPACTRFYSRRFPLAPFA